MVTNAPGFPDFQSAANNLGQAFFNLPVNIPDFGATTFFNGATPQYGHTWLIIGNPVGFYQLNVKMKDRFTGSLPQRQDTFIMAPGVTTMLIPNVMTGLQLEVFNCSTPGGENGFASVGFTNNYSGGYRWLSGPTSVRPGLIAVPANSSSTFQLPFVCPGPAMLYSWSFNPLGQALTKVAAYNVNGTVGQEFIQVNSVTNNSAFQIVLPADPIALIAQNTTGAAINMFTALFATGGMS